MTGIVVGVDDSPGARQALAWAVTEARLRGTALLVVHAYAPEERGPRYFPSQHALPALPTGAVGEPSTADLEQVLEVGEDLREVAAAHAEALVDGLLGEVEVEGVEVEVRVAAARHPGEVLVDLSGEAELLVVGSRGRGGFRGLVLGSVSHAAVLHAGCPVVVVPGRP